MAAACSVSAEPNPVPSKSLHAYAEELRQWLSLTRQSQYVNMCNQYVMMTQALNTTSFTHDANSNVIPAAANGIQAPRQPANNAPPRQFPVYAGTEVRIPSVWRRVGAEAIDFVVLLMVKLCISYILVTFAGLKALDLLDFDYALISGELDLDRFYGLSADIFLVEVIHRILVSFYEAFCLAYVRDNTQPGHLGGFTPGKRIMGICLVMCDEVFSLGNGRFLVTRMSSPSFCRSLTRSFIKNFSMSVLFPSCLTVFMFDHRRTVYDIVTGSVVIDLAYGAQLANRR